MTEHFVVPGQMPLTVAAFSNAADLITWIAKQYGLQSHVTSLEQSFPDAEEVWSEITRSNEVRMLDPQETVERLVPRRVAEPSELATPDGPISQWYGKFFPESGKGLPCVARLRNGNLIIIHTGEDDGCRWEWTNRKTDPLDVVGYWLS